MLVAVLTAGFTWVSKLLQLGSRSSGVQPTSHSAAVSIVAIGAAMQPQFRIFETHCWTIPATFSLTRPSQSWSRSTCVRVIVFLLGLRLSGRQTASLTPTKGAPMLLH